MVAEVRVDLRRHVLHKNKIVKVVKARAYKLMAGGRTGNTVEFNSQRPKFIASLFLSSLLCGIPLFNHSINNEQVTLN